MTDEQVVRTLAEFMGWRECHCRVVGHWKAPDGNYYSEDGFPSYLTSYDALAPVWRKIGLESGGTAQADHVCVSAMGTLRLKFGVEDWGMWFTATPRDHAHALATAIKEAQR